MTYEPVAWMSPDESSVALTKLHESWVPLYTGTEEKYRYGTPLLDAFTTPPAAQRQHEDEEVDCPRCGHCCPQRQPLTDEEIAEVAESIDAVDPTDSYWKEFVRAIETKLKEKNT